MFNNNKEVYAFAITTRYCIKCNKKFETNYYGHESYCQKCKAKQKRAKFMKAPIKGIVKKFIKWADS